MANKKKQAGIASGLVAGGSYLNKLGNIAKGPYTGAFYTGFKTSNRPLYFKPGKGIVTGSKAFNNAVWQAEVYADQAVRNRININADISPGYDWKKTAKVKKIRTAGKIMRTIGKTANVVGLGLIAYDANKWATQWHKDNPGYAEEARNKKVYGLDVSTAGKYGVDY